MALGDLPLGDLPLADLDALALWHYAGTVTVSTTPDLNAGHGHNEPDEMVVADAVNF